LQQGELYPLQVLTFATTLGRWLVAAVKISCHFSGDKTRDAKQASKYLGEPIGI